MTTLSMPKARTGKAPAKAATIQIRTKGKRLKLSTPEEEKPAPVPEAEPVPQEQPRARRRRKPKAALTLIEHWPELLDLNAPKPLATGILIMLVNDAAARNLPLTLPQITIGLKQYLTRPEYHAAVMAGDVRYAPDGTTTPVTDKHRIYAKSELDRLSMTPEEWQERLKQKKRDQRSLYRARRRARERAAAELAQAVE